MDFTGKKALSEVPFYADVCYRKKLNPFETRRDFPRSQTSTLIYGLFPGNRFVKVVMNDGVYSKPLTSALEFPQVPF